MPGSLGRILRTAEIVPFKKKGAQPLTRREYGRAPRPQHSFDVSRIDQSFHATHPWHEALGRELAAQNGFGPQRAYRGSASVSHDILNEDLDQAYGDYLATLRGPKRHGAKELSSAQTHGFFNYLMKNGGRYGISRRHVRLAYDHMLGKNAKINPIQRQIDKVNPATAAIGTLGAGGVYGVKRASDNLFNELPDESQ